MLTTINISSWSDFANSMESKLNRDSREIVYPEYYRGQANSTWGLKTTLERNTGTNLEATSYYKMIEEIAPMIETFTGKKWDLPGCDEFLNDLAKTRELSIRQQNNEHTILQYMAYLRHFGYPSPLLDWTYSPFVAAYFAFRDVASNAESVAIYTYMEAWDAPDITETDQPQIYSLDPKSRNTERHYLQQSIYTVALRNNDGKVYFANHEDPRMVAREAEPYLTKYVLPASERAMALYSLDAYNINSYSLFGSEESLLETMFLRKYIKVQRHIHYFEHEFKDDTAQAW
jgi:hypothetical protein